MIVGRGKGEQKIQAGQRAHAPPPMPQGNGSSVPLGHRVGYESQTRGASAQGTSRERDAADDPASMRTAIKDPQRIKTTEGDGREMREALIRQKNETVRAMRIANQERVERLKAEDELEEAKKKEASSGSWAAIAVVVALLAIAGAVYVIMTQSSDKSGSVVSSGVMGGSNSFGSGSKHGKSILGL